MWIFKEAVFLLKYVWDVYNGCRYVMSFKIRSYDYCVIMRILMPEIIWLVTMRTLDKAMN